MGGGDSYSAYGKCLLHRAALVGPSGLTGRGVLSASMYLYSLERVGT